MSLKGLSTRLACREQTSFQLPPPFLLTSIMACPESSNCYGPVSFQFNAHQLYTALEKHIYRYSSVHTMRSKDLSSEGLLSRGVQHSQGSDPFERDLSSLNTDLPGPWGSPGLPRIALEERTFEWARLASEPEIERPADSPGKGGCETHSHTRRLDTLVLLGQV